MRRLHHVHPALACVIASTWLGCEAPADDAPEGCEPDCPSPAYVEEPRIEPELLSASEPFVVRFRLAGPPLDAVRVDYAGFPLPCSVDEEDRWACDGHTAMSEGDVPRAVTIEVDPERGGVSSRILVDVDRQPAGGYVVIDYGAGLTASNGGPVTVAWTDVSDDFDPSSVSMNEAPPSSAAAADCDAAGTCRVALDAALPDGVRFIDVRYRDLAGNESSSSAEVVVDRVRPAAPSAPPGAWRHERRPWGVNGADADASLVISGAVAPIGERLVVSADDAGTDVVASFLFEPTSLQFPALVVPLPVDADLVFVRSVDGAGNVSSVIDVPDSVIILTMGSPAGAPPPPMVVQALPSIPQQPGDLVQGAQDGAPLAAFDGAGISATGPFPTVIVTAPLGSLPGAVEGFEASVIAGGTAAGGGFRVHYWTGEIWSKIAETHNQIATPDDPRLERGRLTRPPPLFGADASLILAIGTLIPDSGEGDVTLFVDEIELRVELTR